jgi:hypothetical protein
MPHRPGFVTKTPFLNNITLPLTKKGRNPTTDARPDQPPVQTGEASGSATPQHPPVASLDSKKHRPAWITDNQFLEQTTRGLTEKGKNQGELLTLMNLWNIDPMSVDPDNADQLRKALMTFTYKSVVEDVKGKSKEKLEKYSNVGNLRTSARVAFETGKRDSIDAYATLARMGLVNPNASDRPGDSLLERLVAQQNKGKKSASHVRQEAGPSNAAPAIAGPYSPQQRLTILLNLGATPDQSRVPAEELVRMAESTGNSDMTPHLTRFMKDTAQSAIWDKWAEQAGHGYKAQAVDRMKEWVAVGDPDRPLDLSGLDLRDLPDVLPAGLRELVVSNNQLHELDVPAGVTTVNASKNRLETLILSPGVKTVDVHNNYLKSLDQLPEGLKTLNAAKNELRQVTLPKTVTGFNGSHNKLQWLKMNDGLKYLNLARNEFKELKDTPSSLLELDMSHNQLTRPPICHSRLKTFKANDNQLTSLPPQKKGLTTVEADDNRITRLPLYWYQLETMSIARNPLTETQRDEYGDQRM